MTYYTTKTAAAALGVHPSRIRHWYREGKLPLSFRHGRDLAIHPEDIENMRLRNTRRGRPNHKA